jgi:hypothetical protein
MGPGGAALIGTGGGFLSQLVAGLQNKNAQERQWEQDETMLKEGPSWYVQGMEKAGLNPLLAGGQGASPASAYKPSQSTPKVTDPAMAMMAGVQLAKSMSEIELNKSLAGKNRADTNVSDQLVKFRNALNPMKLEYQKLVNKGKEATNRALIVEAQKAESFGMGQAGIDFLQNHLSYQIAKRTGMEIAEAQLLSLKIANLMAAHNYDFFHLYKMPDHGLSWITNPATMVGNVLNDWLKEWNQKTGGKGAAGAIIDAASKKLEEVAEPGSTEGLSGPLGKLFEKWWEKRSHKEGGASGSW